MALAIFLQQKHAGQLPQLVMGAHTAAATAVMRMRHQGPHHPLPVGVYMGMGSSSSS